MNVRIPSAAGAAEMELSLVGPRQGADKGAPQVSAKVIYQDDSIQVGVWECTPGGWPIVDRGDTEVATIVGGKGTLASGFSPPDLDSELPGRSGAEIPDLALKSEFTSPDLDSELLGRIGAEKLDRTLAHGFTHLVWTVNQPGHPMVWPSRVMRLLSASLPIRRSQREDGTTKKSFRRPWIFRFFSYDG